MRIRRREPVSGYAVICPDEKRVGQGMIQVDEHSGLRWPRHTRPRRPAAWLRRRHVEQSRRLPGTAGNLGYESNLARCSGCHFLLVVDVSTFLARTLRDRGVLGADLAGHRRGGGVGHRTYPSLV